MQLTKELKRGENARISVQVTVDKSSVNESIEEIVRDLERRSKIPGFRKGKVPKNLLTTHFAKYIKEETTSRVLSKSMEEVLKGEAYRPISDPVVVEMGDLDRDRDFSFRAEFDVMPEFELPDYKGIVSDRYEYAVGDELVEKELEGLRERFATLAVKEGAAEDGDYLVCDYEEQNDKGAVVNRKQNQTVFLDGKNDALSSRLIGASKGEEKLVELPLESAPDGAPAEGNASTGTLKLTVIEVKRKQLPELNDDFARDISDVQTMDELRKKIRDELGKQAAKRSEEKTRESLIDKLVEKTTLELPKTLVDNEIVQLLANIATAYKIDPKKLFKDEETVKRYRENLMPRAVRNVKYELIMNAVAKRENLDVSEQELSDEIERFAKIGKRDAKEVRESMIANGTLDQFRYRLRQNKALDLVHREADLGHSVKLNFDEQEGSE